MHILERCWWCGFPLIDSGDFVGIGDYLYKEENIAKMFSPFYSVFVRNSRNPTCIYLAQCYSILSSLLRNSCVFSFDFLMLFLRGIWRRTEHL